MLGDVVRRFRVRAGLTQEALAHLSGVSVRNIRDIERDRIARPRRSTLTMLAEALGLDPAELSRRTRGPAQWPRPAQLPADPPMFAGREADLRALTRTWQLRDGPTTTVLTGTAGVGKTTLAVRWAHRIAGEFPDGQLYLNLRGFDPGGEPTDPGYALGVLTAALGFPAERLPETLDARAALYRSLLAGRRMLLVLDNARDAAQVRPLLPGEAFCHTLVTSRDTLLALRATDGARMIRLDRLTTSDARAVLAGRAGSRAAGAEPATLDEIAEACCGLPLPLAVVAARMSSSPGLRLSALAAELRDRTLDATNGGDVSTDLRAVFSWSHRGLTPGAAELFRLLGLHPGPDVAAGVMAVTAARRVDGELLELVDAHLVEERGDGRFAMHDLLRAYAGELGPADDASLSRLLDHYLHTAYRAAVLLDPARDAIVLPPAVAGAEPATFAGRDEATAWFAAELPVLLRLVARAEDAGRDGHVWRLAWTLSDVLHWGGHGEQQIRVQRMALRAAGRTAEKDATARTHANLARTLRRLGRTAEADVELAAALRVYTELRDIEGIAYVNLTLAGVSAGQGAHREAVEHAMASVRGYQELGEPGREGDAHNAVGWSLAQLGELGAAREQCELALRLIRTAGDEYGEANTLDSLGFIHHRLGDHELAARRYEESIAVYRRFGDTFNEARVLRNLAADAREAGRTEAADEAESLARKLLDELEN